MSDNKKQEMSEEDYLKRHLNDLETGKKISQTPPEDLPFVAPEVNTVSDLQFFNMDVRELPCGEFYPTGTLFMVRPAQVKEIQAYSMVDDNNYYDIVEKKKEMFSLQDKEHKILIDKIMYMMIDNVFKNGNKKIDLTKVTNDIKKINNYLISIKK